MMDVTTIIGADPCTGGATCPGLLQEAQLSTTFLDGVVPVPAEALLMQEATVMMKRYVQPVIVVLGTVGNVLVLLIQRRQTSSMSVYLAGLAVSDTIYLWMPASPYFVLDTYGLSLIFIPGNVQLPQTSANQGAETLNTTSAEAVQTSSTRALTFAEDLGGPEELTTWRNSDGEGEGYGEMVKVIAMEVACKVRVWTAYIAMQISAWVLVTMTLHRCLTVAYPHSFKKVLNRKGARAAVIFIFLFFSLLNAHTLYGHTLFGYGSAASYECYFSYISAAYEKFFTDVWTWVDIMLCALVPFVFLIATNIVLIRKVSQSVSEAKRVLSTGNHDDGHFKSRGKKINSMTLTLITISVAFVLLTSPVCVYMILEKTIGADGTDVVTASTRELWFTGTGLFSNTNCAINFYLYCLTGSKYRADFLRLIDCWKSKDKGESTVTSTTKVISTNRQ